MKAFSKNIFPPLIPAFILIVGLEVLGRTEIIPAYLMATPLEVAQTTIAEFESLFSAVKETMLCALAGLLLSTISGIAAALILTRYQFLRRSLTPYAVFFQTVPIIAIAPLLVIWFGFGATTVIASSWIVSFFPVLASATTGLGSADPQMQDLFKLYGASPWKTIFTLKLPWAIPQIFTGLRIAAGLAVIGAIVGEFVAGGGLGSLIDSARTQQRVDIVFAAVLFSTLVGFLAVLFVDLVRRGFTYGRKTD